MPNHIYSSFSIKFLLTLVLTTPPTPNAGIILPIRANAALPQSLSTLETLPSAPPTAAVGLLYRSSPSKCNGVLNSWTAAGVTNCATLAADMYFCASTPMCSEILGAKRGGRLNEAKMVRQSRTVKRAKVGRGTARAGPPVEPKSWVKRLSL